MVHGSKFTFGQPIIVAGFLTKYHTKRKIDISIVDGESFEWVIIQLKVPLSFEYDDRSGSSFYVLTI